MKKTFYKIILVSMTLVAFILGILFAIGEYFFNYALVRNDEKPKGAKRNISSTVLQGDKNIIEENKNVSQKVTYEWINSIKSEKTSIISKDGLNLIATVFQGENNIHRYSIIIHGYSNQKEDFYDIAYNYYTKGFNVFIPDLRAHGESDGKYIGMGWLDKEDIKLWINLIISNDSEAQIVLHGVSMGAAAAMMTAGDDIPSNIKAIIEDCGYTSVKDIFSSELKQRFNLPAFPIIDFMAFVTYIHAGYNIFGASSVNQISKSNVPLLVIHGSLDNFAPVEMAYQIHESANNSDLLIVEGAGHNEARFLQPETYYNKLWKFLDKHLVC